MDILITHGRMARTHSFHLEPLHIGLLGTLVLLLLLALSGPAYRYVVEPLTPASWFQDEAVTAAAPGEVPNGDLVKRDRFMRENLDAMARKVGEMQARLVRLEAIGSRVSSLAGIKPEELRAIDAVPAPAASAVQDGGRPAATKVSGLSVAQGGAGGPYIPAESPSLEQLTEIVAQMELEAEHRTDVFTLVESRLLERRLASLVMPSISPVDGSSIGSGFGFRVDPINGRAALHTGLDFPARIGTPIHAAAGGVVRSVGMDGAYGLMVEVEHGNGLITRYAHTSTTNVKPGELVRRGQTIAAVGNTGRSTGPHLHFEVLLDGVPQNPQRFLSARADAPSDPRAGPRDQGKRIRVR